MKSIALISFGDKNTITDDKKVDISSKKYNCILIGFMKLGQITILYRFDLLR